MVKKSIAAVLGSCLLITSQTQTASAGLSSANNGTSTSSYDYTIGCIHQVGKFDTTWKIFSNKGQVTIYNWDMTGSSTSYDICNGNTVTSNIAWNDNGHQTLKDGEQKVSVVRSKSLNGDTTLKYQTNVVNGEVRMTQIWVDGQKVN